MLHILMFGLKVKNYKYRFQVLKALFFYINILIFNMSLLLEY